MSHPGASVMTKSKHRTIIAAIFACVLILIFAGGIYLIGSDSDSRRARISKEEYAHASLNEHTTFYVEALIKGKGSNGTRSMQVKEESTWHVASDIPAAYTFAVPMFLGKPDTLESFDLQYGEEFGWINNKRVKISSVPKKSFFFYTAAPLATPIRRGDNEVRIQYQVHGIPTRTEEADEERLEWSFPRALRLSPINDLVVTILLPPYVKLATTRATGKLQQYVHSLNENEEVRGVSRDDDVKPLEIQPVLGMTQKEGKDRVMVKFATKEIPPFNVVDVNITWKK
jgi:Icc-related predicted phosphoesterase